MRIRALFPKRRYRFPLDCDTSQNPDLLPVFVVRLDRRVQGFDLWLCFRTSELGFIIEGPPSVSKGATFGDWGWDKPPNLREDYYGGGGKGWVTGEIIQSAGIRCMRPLWRNRLRRPWLRGLNQLMDVDGIHLGRNHHRSR